MSIPPYMLERVAKHYEEAGQPETASRQRQSIDNARNARESRRPARNNRFQNLSTSTKYLCVAAAALSIGTFLALAHQWRNALPEFCPSRFKRIGTEDELLQAVQKDGGKMTQCADPLLLKKTAIEEQIDTILFRSKYCPDGLITAEEKLLEEIQKEGRWMTQCADSTLSVSKESIDNAHKVWHENFDRAWKRKDLLVMITQSPNHYLKDADDDIKDDEAIILAAVAKDGRSLQHASPRLRANRKIVEAALKKAPYMFGHVHPDLCDDKEMVQIAVDGDGYALRFMTPELQNDKPLVLRAVKTNGGAIQYASPALKKDKMVGLAAVKQYGLALELVDEELKKDPDIVNAAIEEDLMALQYLGKGYTPNKKTILDIIKRNDFSDAWKWHDLLKYFPEELKNDDEIVLFLIRQKGYVLEHAHSRFREDKKVVLATIKQHPGEFKYASVELRASEEVVYTAVKLDGWALEHADEKFRSNKKIVLAAVKRSPGTLDLASPELQKDRDIILARLENACFSLKDASDKIKADEEIVFAAIKRDSHEINNAAPSLKANAKFMAKVKPYLKTRES